MPTVDPIHAVAHPYGVARCPECGAVFARTHHRKEFCTPAHKSDYNNRALSRGQAMVTLAMSWRGGRSNKNLKITEASKAAFVQLAALADRYNQEDRAAGRPPAYSTFMRRRVLGQGTMER